jgi:hypothetical protein
VAKNLRLTTMATAMTTAGLMHLIQSLEILKSLEKTQKLKKKNGFENVGKRCLWDALSGTFFRIGKFILKKGQ